MGRKIMNKEFFKTMMDTQKNMMDSWQEMYTKMSDPQDNPYAKAMNDFWEMQKNYVNILTGKESGDISKLFGEYFKNPAFDPKMFESFIEMQKQYMEQLSKYAPGLGMEKYPFLDFSKWMESQEGMHGYFKKLQEYYNPLEMGKAFSPAVKDLLEKMMQANTYYLNVYKFWKELENLQVNPVMDEIKKYVSMLAEKYEVMFKDMVLPMLPQEFQPFAKDPMELFKTYVKSASNFYAPWMDNAKDLRDLFMQGVADREKLGEFFELWRAQFDKTFGAILLSPAMGMNKELIEQQSRAFDTFIDMVLLGTDFTSRIYAVQYDNLDEMVKKYMDMVEQGIQPRTFNEFYTYWSNELEGVFDSYFATPEYSKLIGQLSSAAMDYRIEMHKLMERYLADTPIVTRSEMSSLYKTIYELKKEVKALKKANNATKAESVQE